MPLASWAIFWRWHVSLYIFSAEHSIRLAYTLQREFFPVKLFDVSEAESVSESPESDSDSEASKTLIHNSLNFCNVMSSETVDMNRCTLLQIEFSHWIGSTPDWTSFQSFCQLVPSYYVMLCTVNTFFRSSHVFPCMHMFHFEIVRYVSATDKSQYNRPLLARSNYDVEVVRFNE